MTWGQGSEEAKEGRHTDIRGRGKCMVITALFIISQNWKQYECPSIGK